MMTMVLVGVVAMFTILFAAMAMAPLLLDDTDERETRPISPVSFERRLPQAA
jgi:hypothetical protein